MIGAGPAGLTAARVLADRFDRVVVLDRDELTGADVPGPQPHVILVAGQRAIEELFPGLPKELVEAGAAVVETGSELILHRYGRTWPPMHVRSHMITMTRPLLERAIRRRVADLPHVEIKGGSAVAGLTGDGHRVTGVRFSAGTSTDADLVVDCTGRHALSDAWLLALGATPPEVSEVTAGITYASRLLRRKSGDLPAGQALCVLPSPPEEKRLGVALPVEDDQWLVTLGGWHGEHAGTGDEEYLAYARALPHPALADLLERAEPVSDVAVRHFPSSRWRHFERLRALPAGYVAVGDAYCSFNPVHGQGVTAAALQAQALGWVLDREPDGPVTARFAREFHRAAAAVVQTPWRFAVGGDFDYPETTGSRPRGTGLVNRYAARLHDAARTSVEVRRTFYSVQHLVSPASALFTPQMMAQVIKASGRP
ncbi:FAD-binding monooxygenase [Virgisporangium aliadipatigenens]|uniref:FAD-binding monooxygenase n=1 Tax=Virgisporangium aliadipatigenens TaxID=741659 RepID=A0A8J3YJ33_9ACTN|nr:FAD-binding monooxygenase [Virgisporangium aliadipatigenens]